MKNKKQKENKILFFILLALVFVCIAYKLIPSQMLYYEYKNECQILEKKISEEKKKLEELKHTLELYQSDEYNERLAREKLGLVKPGEQVFIDASGR